MGPIFNEKVTEKWNLWVLKQCTDALFTRPTNLFFNKTFIKNGSHGIIHTFKIYFTTVFRVFRKIRDIQTDPKSFIVIDGSVVVNFPIVWQCFVRLKMFNEKV